MRHDFVEAQELAQGSSQKRSAFWGLLVRDDRWFLSMRAKLLVSGVALALALATVVGIYPFLAITQRVDADVLVVEGWVHPYAIRASVEEFKSHSYQRVFTTGGPIVGKGGYINDYQTSASVGADLLKEADIPSELVQMVPSHVMGRDRTYSSAIALREWFREHGVQVRSLNIVTEGAHARRTRMLFEKAFGNAVRVGVLAIQSPDYNSSRWWQYSEGVEEVISEGIGYLYAKLVFQPETGPDSRIPRN